MEENNIKLKNALYAVIIIALLAFAYAAVAYVNSYDKIAQPSALRTFSVNSEGKVVAKNDVANFTYSVVIEGGKDISQIKKDSDAKTTKIEDFLKAQGIDSKDIQTVVYNLSPRYQYFNCSSSLESARPCPPSEIMGYTLNQTDAVKIRDLSKVEKVISGVVSNGANTVSQLNFTVDEQTALKNHAKAAAIKNAITQAKVLAEAGGFGLGRIVSIDEGGPISYGAYGMGGAVEKSIAVPAPDTSVETGSAEITSNVIIRFEIR
ncbi:MAG: SIMPL domain-containing protein [Patescibacteria group bacterium]